MTETKNRLTRVAPTVEETIASGYIIGFGLVVTWNPWALPNRYHSIRTSPFSRLFGGAFQHSNFRCWRQKQKYCSFAMADVDEQNQQKINLLRRIAHKLNDIGQYPNFPEKNAMYLASRFRQSGVCCPLLLSFMPLSHVWNAWWLDQF